MTLFWNIVWSPWSFKNYYEVLVSSFCFSSSFWFLVFILVYRFIILFWWDYISLQISPNSGISFLNDFCSFFQVVILYFALTGDSINFKCWCVLIPIYWFSIPLMVVVSLFSLKINFLMAILISWIAFSLFPLTYPSLSMSMNINVLIISWNFLVTLVEEKYSTVIWLLILLITVSLRIYISLNLNHIFQFFKLEFWWVFNIHKSLTQPLS